MKQHLISLVLFFSFLLSGCMPLKQTEGTSPNGHIRLAFALDGNNHMTYQVSVGDTVFITPSLLGFTAKDGVNLAEGFKVINTDFTTHDETWTQPWGENKNIRNHYNEMAVHLSDTTNTKLTLRFRIFDDGLGFRYEYEVPGADSILVTDELTAFNIAQDGTSWSIPANYDTYELLYRTQPVSRIDNANTPMTFKTGGLYASIHEAALTDFPEMTLKNTGNCNFKSELAPWPDGIKARFNGGSFKTPWRTIQIAPKAVGLINSGLILNLNEPCALETTDWIRPMKYVGIWWGMHLGVESWVINDRHGATTENAKRYIDFAAANNIEAVMYEGWNEGWENWGGSQTFDYTRPYADFDIEEIARYAREKGVAIIGHHETGGNIMNYEKQLDKSYKWYADLGIHSVKTGYAGGLPDGHNHHGQYNVRHYRNVVETAAKYHTTLDVHEPIKDTGIRRTYPNMMTREGARGMEWNAWSEGNPPEHHVMLPFTRLLAGPMDYTQGAMRNASKANFRPVNSEPMSQGTRCRQLAEYVVFDAPLAMLCDSPSAYGREPECLRFISGVPTVWDETEVLAGEVGDHIVTARRHGDVWYVGGLAGWDGRTVRVDLSLLPEGTYAVELFRDGENAARIAQDYVREEFLLAPGKSFDVKMFPGGGFAARITKR